MMKIAFNSTEAKERIKLYNCTKQEPANTKYKLHNIHFGNFYISISDTGTMGSGAQGDSKTVLAR